MAKDFIVRQGTVKIPNIQAGSTSDIVGVAADGSLITTTVNVSGVGIIGAAEDGSYTDGLFTEFTETTSIGTAIDRFNEVLKSLAPSPAPVLDQISATNTAGQAGKLSFGPSNVIATYTNVPTLDINSSITVGGTISDGGTVTLRGIYNASTTMSGTLNDDVTGTTSYPDNAFGDGDQGSIQLWVNGSQIHSVDLTVFGSGSSVNGNGSGFNLTAATSVTFPNSDPFDVFKYRTGTWTVAPADQRNGYNRVEIRRVNGSTVTSNIFGWVVDNSTTATSYSGESLSGLSMTGSKLLSGVNYHTGGTATYNITIDNAHRNTYSSNGSAITHPTNTNVSIANSSLANIANESESEVISKTVTVDVARILNAGMTVNTRTDRTVQTDSNSTGVTTFNLLVDNTSPDSTATSDSFNDEVYRISSDLDTTVTAGYTSVGASPSEWNSSESLVGIDSGHNNGLLVHNGNLIYPTQGTNGGNFAGITNGPVGNVNYSGATGNRVYLRFFYTADPKQNFRFNVAATSTSFVSVATGPSSNNLTFEVMAPNTTTDGVLLGVWKDAVVPFTSDNAVGCYASSNGSTIPTNWGMTIGSKSTVNSGNVIVVRITASQAWTGSIQSMTITWL